jgi:hypothetical protein
MELVLSNLSTTGLAQSVERTTFKAFIASNRVVEGSIPSLGGGFNIHTTYIASLAQLVRACH